MSSLSLTRGLRTGIRVSPRTVLQKVDPVRTGASHLGTQCLTVPYSGSQVQRGAVTCIHTAWTTKCPQASQRGTARYAGRGTTRKRSWTWKKGIPRAGDEPGWHEQDLSSRISEGSGRPGPSRSSRLEVGVGRPRSPSPAECWDTTPHPSLACEAMAPQLQAANLIHFLHTSPALTLAPSQINQLFYSRCGGKGGKGRAKPKHLSINCIFNIKQGDGPESALSPSDFFF